MNRVDKILNHVLFKEHLEKNQAAEKDRRFCRHNMAHFLDVARIAVILNGDEELGIDREIIYSAALLHDLGRHIQYENSTPHEITGSKIAVDILKECGFREEEIKIISQAILTHRRPEAALEKNLNGLLFRADKLSRPCYTCEMEGECNWKDGKKNRKLLY